MIYRNVFEIESIKRFTDITERVDKIVKESGIRHGICHVYSAHTTCGIKIMEDEILSHADIMTHIEKTIPTDGKYLHDKIELRDVPVDERINAASHIRMLYFPTSETIPVDEGDMMLGEWQKIFMVEMDYGVPFRKRQIIVTVGGIK